MRDEISLITDDDRARLARDAEWIDADDHALRAYRLPLVLIVGAVALAVMAGVALAMPQHINPNGPRMAALPAADDCIARVELFNLAGWYRATETVETEAGPVSIHYHTVGGHNASDHDRIEVTSTPPGTAARPAVAQVRDGESIVVCIIEYVGA